MSNGKFFSGLPDSMLRGSSNRPNRMESQLFWPDESETESVNKSNKTTPLKRATKPVPDAEVQYYKEFMDQNQTDTPKAKELYSQHQTSKIQFNDYDDGGGSSSNGNNRNGVRNNNYNNNRNNKNSAPPPAQVKNVNVTNNYNNRMGYNDNSAKLNALKSNIGFYDYPDESPKTTTRSKSPKHNAATTTNTNSRSDDKCKMNNEVYDLDKRVNNINLNTNNMNNSNDYSVNKSSRIIEETRNRNGGGGGGYDDTPIKIRNETTHSSSSSTSSYSTQAQQYQNAHNVPISLDRDYMPGRSSRGCPQKSYNNITPLYSEQEQSPVIHAKSRAHDHLKSNIFFQNNSNNTTPPATTPQHRPLGVRDSAVCRVGVGLPDM